MAGMNIQGRSLKNMLYVAGNGYVRAFDCSGGQPQLAWTTNLEGSGYQVVSLIPDLNQLYAGCNGYIFRLDGRTGKIVWTKKLSKLTAYVSMAINGAYLVCGLAGFVATLDKESGNLIWEASLDRAGYKSVTILLIPNQVLAASGGRLYALNSLNGNLIWGNGLSGCGFQGTSISYNPSTMTVHSGVRGFVNTTTSQGADGYHVSLKDTGYQPVHQIWINNHWIVLTTNILMSLNPHDGAPIWRVTLTNTSWSADFCGILKKYKGELWVSNANSIMHIDLNTGNIIQQYQTSPGFNLESPFLNFVFLNDSLYVNLLGVLYQIDCNTGTVLWSDPLEGLGYTAHFLATFDQWHDLNRGNIFAEREMQQERANGGLLSLFVS